jgi:hypothetical protein
MIMLIETYRRYDKLCVRIYLIVTFVLCLVSLYKLFINPLNAELNPICHLLELLGTRHIFHVSGLRVNARTCIT